MTKVIINTPFETIKAYGDISGGKTSNDGLTPQDPYEFTTTEVFVDGEPSDMFDTYELDAIINSFFTGEDESVINIREESRKNITK